MSELEDLTYKHEFEGSFVSSHYIGYGVIASNELSAKESMELIKEDDHIYLRNAMWEAWKRFIPSTLSFVVEYGVILSNIIFISMLDDPVLLSGWGLGNTTVNVIVFSVDVGICGGIDTLVSQAYGRKDYYMCGVYLNTARIVLAMMAVVQFLLLINWNTIFVYLGLPPDSSEVAQQYILSILPGVFMGTQFEWLRRFLTVQGIYNPILYILTSSILIHISSLYIYVILLDLGIFGVAIATATTYSIDYIGMTLYIHFKKDLIHKEAWHLPNKLWISKIPQFLKYGIPSCLMLLFEWWAFEIINVYWGWLGVKQLASYIIVLSILITMYLPSLGIAVWSTNLIGNHLGSNKPNWSKTYSLASLTFGMIIESILLILFFLFRDTIISVYTTDTEVIFWINQISILWYIFTITDLLQGVLTGTIRAIGYQNQATIIAVITYWIILLPISYIFAFPFELGFIGIWIGFPLWSCFQVSCFLYIIFTAPWKEIALKASKQEHIEFENDANIKFFIYLLFCQNEWILLEN